MAKLMKPIFSDERSSEGSNDLGLGGIEREKAGGAS